MNNAIRQAKQPGTSAQMSGALVRTRPPRVSIGLPVYNGEPFLSRTLDALLAQTFGDFEVIVSDNASTDRTVAIVRDYAARDKRILLYENKQNYGAVYNYNRTLALASGEYFKWMAADDVIQPEFLARCVNVLNEQLAVVLVYAKSAFIDEHDRVIYCFDDVMKLPSWPSAPVARSRQMLQAIFRNGSAANVVVFGLARTEALRTIRPLGSYFGCDYVAVTELALLGEIYEIPSVMAFYRRHQQSSSTYKRPSAASQQQFYDPSVTGRLRQEMQLRRRYAEVFRAIIQAKLGLPQRALIAASAISYVAGRAVWRAGFELRSALGHIEELQVDEQIEGIGLHWSEFPS